MPCGSHSLNLVLLDMTMQKRFLVLVKQYNVFSNSAKTWIVLLEYIDDLTWKSLSIARWESHIEKAIETQVGILKML